MSYISPEEFSKRLENDEFYGFAMLASEMNHDKMQVVIEALKPINQKDPGFCYSCMCKGKLTEWRFGYIDYDVYKEADSVSEKLMRKDCKGSDLIAMISSAMLDPETDACVCPFSGGN